MLAAFMALIKVSLVDLHSMSCFFGLFELDAVKKNLCSYGVKQNQGGLVVMAPSVQHTHASVALFNASGEISAARVINRTASQVARR